uniref:Galectin n=1 Tax=Rhabditophanes sp. KR3021 TaxID=114890 RepID=A0AC35TVN2_9BILA
MGIGDGVGINFTREVYNPKLKFVTPIRGFEYPQHIRLIGQSHKGAKQFKVDFNNSSNDIIFHFNVRFNEKAVVRNSCINGVWQKEERAEKEFPFHHGAIFTLDFIAHPDHVEVKKDGEHFIKFVYRDNYHNVVSMDVDGDIELHHVAVHQS